MSVQDQNTVAKGPGHNSRGNREGFSFDEGRGGGGRGSRDGRGGRGKDGRREGGGAAYRVVNELSALEKALTKADYAGQKGPLDEVLKALRPMNLKRVEDLDLNTRGRLITSLMRVLRQPKPKVEPDVVQEAPVAEVAAPAEASPEADAGVDGPTAVDAAQESTPVSPPAAPEKPAGDPRLQQWTEVIFGAGLIWRTVGDSERAATAFESAGRQPTADELAVPKAQPVAERSAVAQVERGARPPRGEKRERREKGPRIDRQTSRFPTPVLFVSSGDWQADVKKLEEMGRTRDAGRMHEKNKSFADAARLFASGADFKSAFRCAALGQLEPLATELAAKLQPDEIVMTLERAEAWERLMAYHVSRQDFDAVARLYERARQFDQAAIAWERGGKLAAARKAFERANDTIGALRVTHLEAKKLVERGDRLGAATLQLGAGLRDEALETLKALPPPKAYHFMEKLKLEVEAKAFASEELEKSRAAGNLLHVARWLELLGDKEAAIETYILAERKDKAAGVYETMGQHLRAAELMEHAGHLDRAGDLFRKAGDLANAERVAALPRPAVAPKTDEVVEAKSEGELGVSASASDSAVTP